MLPMFCKNSSPSRCFNYQVIICRKCAFFKKKNILISVPAGQQGCDSVLLLFFEILLDGVSVALIGSNKKVLQFYHLIERLPLQGLNSAMFLYVFPKVENWNAGEETICRKCFLTNWFYGCLWWPCQVVLLLHMGMGVEMNYFSPPSPRKRLPSWSELLLW